MADKNETPEVGGSAGDNPDAESWVDPNSVRSEFADGQPAEAMDEGQLYIQSRLQELKEEGALGEVGEAALEAETAEPDTEEAPKEGSESSPPSEEGAEPKEEAFSEGLIRLMEKEAELRREREELDKYREEYEAYKQAVEAAKKDPLKVLKAHGITSEEDLLDIAKKAYYESLGEEAPQEYAVSREIAALKAEIAELKGGTTEKVEAQQQQQLVQDYSKTLTKELGKIDFETNALMAKIKSKFGDEGMQSDILRAAEHYYAQEGKVPTPQQAVEKLQTLYEQQYGWLVEKNESEPAKEETSGKKKSKTLRNKSTKAQPQGESLEKYKNSHGDPEAYQKITEISRANFYEQLKNNQG
jgi:hypothetical protein